VARFPLVPGLLRRRRAADVNGGDPAAVDAGGDEAPAMPQVGPQRVPMPTRGQLRRERRLLVAEREERIRDLGGLMLDMYRRNQFRQALVFDRCNELLAVERRLRELETLLTASSAPGGIGVYGRCVCGAPLFWGGHFCTNCGRAIPDAPIVSCARCSNPLAADARFCPACGSYIEAAAESAPAPPP
jgi:Double zinc ribbon